MNILIIPPDYPDRHRSVYPFVKQLVDEFARQGHNCMVIAPFSVTKNKRFYPFEEKDERVTIYRPNYVSFSKLKIGTFKPSTYFRQKAINRALKQLPTKPDVVYCHFWGCAPKAYPYASKNNIPLFVASGESSIPALINPNEISQEVRDYISGVICVSSKNRNESIELGLTVAEKCGVFPNAVNSELFYKREREECRKRLGLPKDAFIVAFVGWFINRKGPQRVAEAIEKVGGVNSIFIGKGTMEPHCEGILYKGALPHNEVPLYLSAADCFVLPTLAEGCSNAVVEAMSCGLPVVSSNLPFNWDVLDNTNSIMVNPNNVDEIATAIKFLRDNKDKREELSRGALKKANALTIDNRAMNILNFINTMMTRKQ